MVPAAKAGAFPHAVPRMCCVFACTATYSSSQYSTSHTVQAIAVAMLWRARGASRGQLQDPCSAVILPLCAGGRCAESPARTPAAGPRRALCT